MAYPLLKYNSSTGSDTNPSDCAASSVTESATASGSASGTTITFSSSVDLSACADDDSDWMWCATTNGGIHLFRITAFTGGLSTCTAVTVEQAITADFSGAAWHVNGTRQSLNADSSSAFGLDGNQWRKGWTVELDGTFAQTTGLNLLERETGLGAVDDPQFVLRASSSASTKPIVRVTATWARAIRLLDYIQCYVEGIRFETAYNSNAAFECNLGGLTFADCDFIHTGSGVGASNNFLVTGNGTFRLFNCYFRSGTCAHVVHTNVTQQLIMDNCWIDARDSGGATAAVEAECENVVITNTLITESAGVGINMSLSSALASQGYWFFKNNTIVDCAGTGIAMSGTPNAQSQPKHGFYIVNNLITDNGGWGIDLSTTQIAVRGNNVDWNAFRNNTSGTITGKDAGANDITLTADPYTDAANDDYSLNNTAGGGALLRDGARYDIPTGT